MKTNVTINAIGLASELAQFKIRDSFPENKYLNFDKTTKTYTYTDEAQDLFNKYYDEYLNMIELEQVLNVIGNAKEVLKEHGYYVENLWHIDDVKQNYNVSDQEAYDIIDKAMQSSFIMNDIFEQIDYTINSK
jgi:hypothetical protein